MKTIFIDDISYNIPSDWNDINLKTLLKITELQNKTFETELEKNIQFIKALTSLTDEVLMTLPVEDFKTLLSLFDYISEFPDPTKTIPGVSIDGVKYVPVELNQMTTGEFISIEVFQNRPDREDNLHVLAAILIRPEVDGHIEKLKDINNINDRAAIFLEKLMVGDYWPIVQSFFVGAASSSLNNTQASSDKPKNQSKLRIQNS